MYVSERVYVKQVAVLKKERKKKRKIAAENNEVNLSLRVIEVKLENGREETH